jgi:hypothetical protein
VVVALLTFLAALIMPIAGWQMTLDIWPVPLDDAYIYAQYARNFAHGELFAWSPGEGYTRGATSPLYPLLLAPGWLIGFRDHWIMLWAMVLNVAGFIAASFAIHDVLAKRTSREFAFLGVGIFITCGPTLWNVASGMEAGLAMGAAAWMARAFLEALDESTVKHELRFVSAVAVLCALRPEALATCGALSAVVLFTPGLTGIVRRAGRLALGAVPIAAYFLLNAIMTGEFLTASMLTKSIWGDPTVIDHGQRFLDNLGGLSDTAIQVFLGVDYNLALSTFTFFLFFAVISIFSGDPRLVRFAWLFPAFAIQVLFLCGQRNPLGVPHARYLAPWLPIIATLLALGVYGAVAAMEKLASESSFEERIRRELRFMMPIMMVLNLICFMPAQLTVAIETVGEFASQSRALQANQIAVGRHISEMNRTTPGTVRRLMTHDAGALMYFAEVRGFDAHGLCMEMPGYPLHTAQYQGTFFAWEGLEATWPHDDLPDVSCVFAEGWGKPPWTEEELFRPSDAGIIAPARLMQHIRMYRFPKELVGSAHTLTVEESGGWDIVDRVDFADLNSEAVHDFFTVLPDVAPYHMESVLLLPEREPPLADVARTNFGQMLFTVKHRAGPIRIVALAEAFRPGELMIVAGKYGTQDPLELGGGPRFVETFSGSMPAAGTMRVGFIMRKGAALSIGNVYVLQPSADVLQHPADMIPHGEAAP